MFLSCFWSLFFDTRQTKPLTYRSKLRDSDKRQNLCVEEKIATFSYVVTAYLMSTSTRSSREREVKRNGGKLCRKRRNVASLGGTGAIHHDEWVTDAQLIYHDSDDFPDFKSWTKNNHMNWCSTVTNEIENIYLFIRERNGLIFILIDLSIVVLMSLFSFSLSDLPTK